MPSLLLQVLCLLVVLFVPQWVVLLLRLQLPARPGVVVEMVAAACVAVRLPCVWMPVERRSDVPAAVAVCSSKKSSWIAAIPSVSPTTSVTKGVHHLRSCWPHANKYA